MKKKYKLKKSVKYNMLLVLFICIFLFCVIKIGIFFVEVRSNDSINDKLVKDLVTVEKITKDDKEVENFIVDFEGLLDINKDVRGWIRFNNDKINYPIVQSSDNSYYLNHTINKKKNSLGSIFMDFRNYSFKDRNVVLFGHNSTSGSMFGSLKDALKAGFFDNEENRIIEIIDVNNITHYYEIFSVYTTVKEEYYITTEFDTVSDFSEFLKTITRRSVKKFNSDLSESDNILTLSTCNGVAGTNKRLVIHARLVE